MLEARSDLFFELDASHAAAPAPTAPIAIAIGNMTPWAEPTDAEASALAVADNAANTRGMGKGYIPIAQTAVRLFPVSRV